MVDDPRFNDKTTLCINATWRDALARFRAISPRRGIVKKRRAIMETEMSRAIAWKALNAFGTESKNGVERDLNKTYGRRHLPKCEIIEAAAAAETMHFLFPSFGAAGSARVPLVRENKIPIKIEVNSYAYGRRATTRRCTKMTAP